MVRQVELMASVPLLICGTICFLYGIWSLLQKREMTIFEQVVGLSGGLFLLLGGDAPIRYGWAMLVPAILPGLMYLFIAASVIGFALFGKIRRRKDGL